jgi:hypothetical protein
MIAHVSKIVQKASIAIKLLTIHFKNLFDLQSSAFVYLSSSSRV